MDSMMPVRLAPALRPENVAAALTPGEPVMPDIGARSVAAAADFLEASRTGSRRQRPRMGRAPSGSGACDGETVLRMILAIAEEYPCYGHRRVTMELRRRGIRVNRKRVRRIMRAEGLCALPSRRRTKDADFGIERPAPKYPNLVLGIEIDRPNQVWAADITCIGLETEFVFLAVILDVFTRRCIGWSLGRNGHEGHIMRALRKALRERAGKDLAGLIHHSDQGIVYASREYVEFLAGRNIRISMSRRGNPYDNAYVERFFETLKYEDVYLNGYHGFDDALDNIRKFIDDVYNTKRLHSAIGYRPPGELEKAAASITIA